MIDGGECSPSWPRIPSSSVSATRRVAVVDDLRYRDHRSPPGHPEHPGRLAAVHEAIAARGDALRVQLPRPASDEELLRVHRREHLVRVADAAERAPSQLDPDTYVSAQSHDVARLAAGAAIELARAVARGEVHAGFAALRPPGHHAEADRAMGFCLFNSVAVAARALQAEDGVERVLVLDWDVHHGNGTQHSFEADPSILYFSTHQFPYYPGSGDVIEIGRGAGEGATLNVPLPAGCGDDEYVGVFQRVLVPVVQAWRPEIVLVSCGFDAHADDPLASMQLTRAGFLELARITRALADETCQGRLALFLEGGYAATGLREGTAAVLDALLEPTPAPLRGLIDAPKGSTLARVVDQVGCVQRRFFPTLGAI